MALDPKTEGFVFALMLTFGIILFFGVALLLDFVR